MGVGDSQPMPLFQVGEAKHIDCGLHPLCKLSPLVCPHLANHLPSPMIQKDDRSALLPSEPQVPLSSRDGHSQCHNVACLDRGDGAWCWDEASRKSFLLGLELWLQKEAATKV